MNSIVILCGGVNSGKTTTMKGFFGVSKNSYSSWSFIKRKLDGKIICAVSFSSPQEKEGFCEVNDVKENIKERITECNEETKGEPYILIIPFTMRTRNKDRKKLNENCILKPIQHLRKRFNVFVIYLKKKKIKRRLKMDDLMDALMEGIASYVIETTKDDCDMSKELENYLKKKVIKSI